MQKSLDQMNLTVAPRHLAARLDVSLAGLIAILSSSWTAWASNGEEQKTDDAYARRRHASQHHGFSLNESRTPTGASKRLIGWEVVLPKGYVRVQFPNDSRNEPMIRPSLGRRVESNLPGEDHVHRVQKRWLIGGVLGLLV